MTTARPRPLRRGELPLLVTAALCLLAGLVARPVASVASDDVAAGLHAPVHADTPLYPSFPREPDVVASDALNDTLTDPWGRPWRVALSEPDGRLVRLYSIGPDGRDDQGAGDDVVLDRAPPGLEWLLRAPLLGAIGACVLVWCWLALRAWRAPRGRAILEAWRATLLASLPVSVITALLLDHEKALVGLRDVIGAQRLFVPAPIAVSATLGLVVWLAALRLRLRRRGPGDGDPDPVAPELSSDWRRQVAAAAVALVALGVVGGWTAHDQAARDRRDLLARACLGELGPVLTSGDLELIREFARGAPARVRFAGRDDRDYQALAQLGPDANDVMTRALEDQSRVPLARRGYRSVPWNHLREHDPALDGLVAAVAARPDEYRGLLFSQPALFASRVGRTPVAKVLLEQLEHTDPTGDTSNGYPLRTCDDAVQALAALFPTAPPFRVPAWNEQTLERWDEAVAGARTWAAAGAVVTEPLSWAVFDVRGLTLANGSARVELDLGEDGRAGAVTDQPVQLLVHRVTEARSARVVDKTTGRHVDVALSGRPGETEWITVDLPSGSSTTRTYTPPP